MCYILNDKDHLGKFDARSDEGMFIGYSGSSSSFRVHNTKSLMIMESVNVVFDDSAVVQWEEEEEGANEQRVTSKQTSTKDEMSTETEGVPPTVSSPEQQDEVVRVHRNHSASDIIGNMNKRRRTRGVKMNYLEMVQSTCFISTIGQRDHTEALADKFWTQSMQEKLEQFIRNEVLELVEKPVDGNIVETKWIFKNKIDETGAVVRNIDRLVAKGYSQIERVDFEETFAHVARLESIRLFIGMFCILNFTIYQMDVHSALLNGVLQAEVFVHQPK